jgi:Reverse transcriptase (RNA-dependent DNA polymerase)
MALAHESVEVNLRVISTEEHSITIAYGDLVITAVYLPPSLTTERVEQILQRIDPRADIVVGDVNVALGFQTRMVDTPRRLAIASTLSSRGLAWVKPEREIKSTRLDHVFALPERAITNYVLSTPPIKTDHPMLNFRVSVGRTTLGAGSVRFNISRLNNNICSKSFISLVDALMDKVLQEIPAVSAFTPYETSRERIVCLDAILLFVIQTALHAMVGTHTGCGSRKLAYQSDPKDVSIVAAIRSIRSAQRTTNTSRELTALDIELTPEEEAVAHYTAIYKRHTAPSAQCWETENTTPAPRVLVNEVMDAIKNYPMGKSPGNDGIDCRTLSLLRRAPSFIAGLTRLYTSCSICGFTPPRWNESVVSPIPKAGKDPRYIRNRRPVSLTVMFRRIFEKILLPSLTGPTSLNRGQAGFRHGFSCSTQILLAEQARHSGRTVMAFIDLQAAYDSVPIDRLLIKLGNKDVPKYLIRLVESLLSNCSSRIAVNGNLTDPVKLEKGLFQGSLLSPILFDIYIDDLAELLNGPNIPSYSQSTTAQLHPTQTVPKCLLFADDILINAVTPAEMQELLNAFAQWLDLNEMAINVAKCGTLTHNQDLKINDLIIPKVETYRYLGIPLGINGIIAELLLEEIKNRFIGAFLTVKYSLASQLWPHAIKVNVYKIFVRSAIEHAAPLLTLLKSNPIHRKIIENGLTILQGIQRECISWIFQRSKHATVLESLTGLLPLPYRFAELTACFRLHIEDTSEENPIKEWLGSPLACPLIKTARNTPIPPDKKANTIKHEFHVRAACEAARRSKMVSHIDPTCRLLNGMDPCLTIQNHAVRNLAIIWRINAFGHHQICRICNTAFTRRHAECANLDIPKGLLAEHGIVKNTGTRGKVYTILDHLLNRKETALFAQSMEIVKSTLAWREMNPQAHIG